MAQKGFSLAEVLVALAILSGAILGAMALISQSTRSAIEMEQRLLASIVAENIIAETQLSESANSTMSLTGEVILAGQEWQWRREITQSSFAGLYSIKVDVGLENGEQQILSVSAYQGGR